jgi:hypothetical protein
MKMIVYQCNKKIATVFIFLVLIPLIGLSQLNFGHRDGRKFLKRIEYNFGGGGLYNFDCKTDIERLFFGDFNAMVEFFIRPSFEGAYGFRILKDSSNNFIVEHKRISNWDTVWSQLDKEFPRIVINADKERSMTEEERDKIATHNREMYDKKYNESLYRYKIVNQFVPVSNLFVEKLHELFVTAIDNFVGKGTPLSILDGYRVTFRCVIEDEVWTLTIHNPKNEILKLVDVCNQMIKDIKTNNVNELTNYITLFEAMISLFEKSREVNCVTD